MCVVLLRLRWCTRDRHFPTTIVTQGHGPALLGRNCHEVGLANHFPSGEQSHTTADSAGALRRLQGGVGRASGSNGQASRRSRHTSTISQAETGALHVGGESWRDSKLWESFVQDWAAPIVPVMKSDGRV